MSYHVTVTDTYCGVKGRYVDEMELPTQEEASAWVKQFKKEYPKEDGYKVQSKPIN